MPGRSRSRRLVALAGLLPLVALACTDDGASTPTVAPARTTTTTEPPRADDGVLRIGVLLPETGSGAGFGAPLIDAVDLAAEQINEAGGVLGRPVELVHADEGDTPSAARDAIADLLDEDVDAVVGPASSTIALATLSDLLEGGVLTCSPTATALALDDFPERDLFFRTAPSDSLQALAIADEAERTGALTAAVMYLDDLYGRPFAEATIAALEAKGITVEDRIGFAAGDSLVDEATSAASSGAGVFVVIGDAEQGVRMLSTLGEVTGVASRENPPSIIVNDAMRRPASPQQIAELATDVRERIIGLSPSVSSGNSGEPPGAFATNAYDCVNLIALAAARAGSDNPRAIAAQIASVSRAGVTCHMFAECTALLEQVPNVDYDGPGGYLELGADGDPVVYRYDKWSFDAQGVDYNLTPPILVTRA